MTTAVVNPVQLNNPIVNNVGNLSNNLQNTNTTNPNLITNNANNLRNIPPTNVQNPLNSMPPSTPFASASLYVGDLAPNVTEALLFEIFNAVGPCASVRVCRDSTTRRSLGYAYVNFHRVEDAERALDTLNFKPISGRPCRIMWCHRDPSLRKSGVGNIFVNHLDKAIDHKMLYDTFSRFGNILSCKVATNPKGESLGYGFVHFENDEAAQHAIQVVDGKKILNSVVQVQAFKSKKERHGNSQTKAKFTNVFVKNLPGSITKEQLDIHFTKAGAITSSVISQDKQDKTRAYGFVNYGSPEEASKAVEILNNLEIDGKKLYVGRAQKKEEREKELREKFEAAKVERAKKYQGTNLYVKNLSDDMSDEKLRNLFTSFGAISSARVMKDTNSRSRNFGFVCFSSAEEATKAVTEMNGKLQDGKPLYVAIAQRKDQRRAMLENQFSHGNKNQRNNVGGPMQMPGPNMGFMPGNAGQFPMFTGQIPNVGLQRQMIYPQQFPLGMPRWQGGPNAPQGPHLMGTMGLGGIPQNMRGPNNIPLNYPMNVGPNNQNQNLNNPQNRNMNQQRGRPHHQGGHGGHNQNQHHNQNQNQRQGGQNVGFRYNDNARNLPNNRQQNNNQMIHQQNQPQQNQQNTDNSNQNQLTNTQSDQQLNSKTLLAAPVEMRKQLIGEKLFPLVQVQQPNLAGKITGMLLEMEDSELLHLLESSEALSEKIKEAIQVLQQHEHEPPSDK